MAEDMGTHRRSSDEDGCYVRHHRCMAEAWSNELEPKIRNLIWKRVIGAVIVCAGAMIFISLGVVNAQNFVKKPEVERGLEKVEGRVMQKIDSVQEGLQKDLDKVSDSQIRMEDKIDHMMELMIQPHPPVTVVPQ